MSYRVEYTDTFGGEANYSWLRTAVLEDPRSESPAERRRLLLRAARAKLGLTGLPGRITADFGDEWRWVPDGCCTVLIVRYDDYTK